MIFESSMQLWITHNGEREKLRFPVLPTKFDVTHGTKNTSVTISGLGEILVLQDRAAAEVSWDSFFPAAYFPGIQTPFMLSSPDAMMQRLFEWKISAKPVHLILTGTRVNFYAAIQSFQPYRKGGPREHLLQNQAQGVQRGQNPAGQSQLDRNCDRLRRLHPDRQPSAGENLHGQARRLPLQHLEIDPRRRRPVQRNLFPEQG